MTAHDMSLALKALRSVLVAGRAKGAVTDLDALSDALDAHPKASARDLIQHLERPSIVLKGPEDAVTALRDAGSDYTQFKETLQKIAMDSQFTKRDVNSILAAVAETSDQNVSRQEALKQLRHFGLEQSRTAQRAEKLRTIKPW